MVANRRTRLDALAWLAPNRRYSKKGSVYGAAHRFARIHLGFRSISVILRATTTGREEEPWTIA